MLGRDNRPVSRPASPAALRCLFKQAHTHNVIDDRPMRAFEGTSFQFLAARLNVAGRPQCSRTFHVFHFGGLVRSKISIAGSSTEKLSGRAIPWMIIIVIGLFWLFQRGIFGALDGERYRGYHRVGWWYPFQRRLWKRPYECETETR